MPTIRQQVIAQSKPMDLTLLQDAIVRGLCRGDTKQEIASAQRVSIRKLNAELAAARKSEQVRTDLQLCFLYGGEMERWATRVHLGQTP
jgi:DNA-binding CsgD family transcriptional regulator